MTTCVPATPECSRSGTDRYTAPSAPTQTTIAIEPVCRRVSGAQTTVPSPAN